MPRRVNEKKKGGGSPAWMSTYGDLTTLLLCFFVLLFSMSSIDVSKFKAAMSSFANQIDIMPGGEALTGEELITNGISQLDEIAVILENKNPTKEYSEDVGKNEGSKEEQDSDMPEKINDQTSEMAKEIEEYLANEGIVKEEVLLSYNSNYVKLTLSGEVLFDVGKADVKPEAEYIIDTIANMIVNKNYLEYDIQIDGHTDDWDINTVQYPSNWYLSSARAIAVGDMLINTYDFSPDKIACTGYGEYRAIADNETAEGRAKNRRVEIKIIIQNEEKSTDDISLKE